MAKIPVVDESDNIICYKERDEVEEGDIYRVSSLWITNSSGQVLLARRAYTKKHDPGVWGPAVAGTVEEGETYEINIYKEAEEELGITGVQFDLGEYKRKFGKHNYFSQSYFVVLDWEIDRFTLQKEEVAEVKWFAVSELEELLKSNPNEFLQTLHIKFGENNTL